MASDCGSAVSSPVTPLGPPVTATKGKGMMDNLSNYIIVDIGANLTNKKFSRDLDQVIKRATGAGALSKNILFLLVGN